VQVNSILLTTDTPSVPTGGTASANITAYVSDAGNNLLSGVPVQFTTDSGLLSVTQPVTGDNGAATAVLTTSNNAANRDITITARVGGVESTLVVPVSGTTLTIQGPDALVSGVAGTYTVILSNSAGGPVMQQAVTVTAPTATLSNANLVTDSNGRATFTMSQSTGGSIALQASGAGAVASKTVTVSADNFAFTTPEADVLVPIGTAATFTVNWLVGGEPVANGTRINFSTTRGTLSTTSVDTAGGSATVTLTSASAGEAVVTASNAAGTVTTSRRIFFIATTAASVSLQASPGTVGINQSSTLTATVRDPENNLVAGKTVRFEIVTDPTQGSLTVGTATTDMQGRASTVYQATSTPSALDGVEIRATVVNPLPGDSQPPSPPTTIVKLTVAGAPSSIVFGTGNTIQESDDDSLYILRYSALVKDITGAAVANVPVTISIEPEEYAKGQRTPGPNSWLTAVSATCPNEDRNFNDIFDAPDVNNQGNEEFPTLQPGGVVAVELLDSLTRADGTARFVLRYPQDHAYYVRVRIRARTTVQGTEYSSTTSPFWLPGASSDFNNLQVSPPGMASPFGTSDTCSNHL